MIMKCIILLHADRTTDDERTKRNEAEKVKKVKFRQLIMKRMLLLPPLIRVEKKKKKYN